MTILRSAEHIYHQLTEPHPQIREADERVRVQLLAAVTLLVTFLSVLVLVMMAWLGDWRVVWIAVMLLVNAGLYILSRSLHYLISLRLLPLVMLIAVLGVSALNPRAQGAAIVILPVLVAGLFWSPRGLIGLTIASAAGATLVVVRSASDFPSLLPTLIFLLVIAFIQVVNALHQYRIRQALGQRTHELSDSQNRFRAVIENTPDGYYLLRSVTDAHGQVVDFEIIDVNTAALAMSAAPRSALVGLRVKARNTPPTDRQFKIYKTMVDTHQPVHEETFVEQPDGSVRWYSLLGIPVGDGLAVISSEITERKQAEEALRESENRFRHMADHAPMLMWMSGPDGACTYFNRGWLEFTGRTETEELGRGWIAGIHPDDVVTCMAAYESSYVLHEPFQYTYRLRRHDGVYRWIQDRGVPRFSDTGMFLGYIGSAVDVTDQIETETALRESQARLHAIIGSLPFELWAQDKDGRYVLQNATSTALWGSLIGKQTPERDLPAAVLAEWQANNQRALAGEMIRKEVVYPGERGLRYTYNIVVPIYVDNEILGIGGVNIDITETKQMEAKLRALLEAIPDFMARISREGVYLEVIHGSDFEDKRAPGEIIGMTVYNVMKPEAAEQRMQYIRQTLETGRLQAYEYPLIAPSGKAFQLEARIAPSGPDEVLLMVRDVTARREAETHRLNLSLERERIDLLRRFVGDRTHDLMTPLTIIKTSLYLLTKASSSQRRAEHVAKLQNQVDNLENMIRNMLMMLRLDKPIEDEFDFVLQDLNALAERLTADHQPVAISRGQILQFDGQASLPLVAFDGEKIERALSNLIDNALKYTETGGTVQVSTRAADRYVCVSVRDNGRGIPSADLPHVFDRFFRSQESQSAVGGSGLGLAIVDKIVRAHGGRVEAESEASQGSTFRIFLPLVTETEQRPG